jgi:hypothetical protein
MRYWLGGFIQHPAALTGVADAYRIAFTADPWNEGSSGRRGAARAELIADGYEWYYRTVYATARRSSRTSVSVPLQRISPGAVRRVADGARRRDVRNRAVVDTGDGPQHRVTAQANGSTTVQAISQGDAGQGLVSVCCVSGDDRAGIP